MITTCKLIKSHSCNPYTTWTLQGSSNYSVKFFVNSLQCSGSRLCLRQAQPDSIFPVCVENSCFHAGFFKIAKPVSTVFHPGFDPTELMAQDYYGFSTHVEQTTD